MHLIITKRDAYFNYIGRLLKELTNYHIKIRLKRVSESLQKFNKFMNPYFTIYCLVIDVSLKPSNYVIDEYF